jgi:16S rRNA (uracil1498-N3)-methyltransferase
VPARRFFTRDVHRIGDRVAIEGSDAHKIVRVLRLRTGDVIELVDSAGALFSAEIETNGDRVDARLVELRAPNDRAAVRIDVAQGIPKSQKMDYVVEKLSELGACSVIPIESERTIVRGASDAKIERWQRVARSAARQSGRRDVLDVRAPVSFKTLCEELMPLYDVVLMPWEIAAAIPLREQLPALLGNASSVLIVVGPEGGFSHAEADAAQAAGAHLIWLGPQILRTETAALVATAIVLYQLG